MGPQDAGAPLPFCPATAGAQRERAVPDGPRVGARPSSRAHLPRFARQGGGPQGLPRPLPRPCTAQRSASSVPSRAVRWALSPTGFVIASRPFPPSASPTSAGPPSAPPPRRGASPGTHTGLPRAGAPISCRRTPQCRSRAGEALGSVPPPVRPAYPAWWRRTGCWGWGSRQSAAVEMLGRWQTRMRWVSNRPRPRSGTAQVRPVKEQKGRRSGVLGGEGRWKEGLF